MCPMCHKVSQQKKGATCCVLIQVLTDRLRLVVEIFTFVATPSHWVPRCAPHRFICVHMFIVDLLKGPPLTRDVHLFFPWALLRGPQARRSHQAYCISSLPSPSCIPNQR